MAKFIFILLCFIPLAWSSRVNANYFTIKSFLLYLVGGLSFLAIAFQKKDRLSLPAHEWKWLAGLFVGLQIIYAFTFGFPLGLFALPKFLSLIAIVLFLSSIQFDLSLFLKKQEWLIVAFFGVLFILTSRDFASQVMDLGLKYQSGMVLHPFGNVNMLAEYYLLCLPLVYYWLTQKNEIAKSVKVIAFVLINVVLLATKSRSAYLGLGLWWVLWLYQTYFQQRAKLFLTTLAMVILIGSAFVYKADFSLGVNKSYSLQERLNFYRSSIDLILDHPIGVGSQFATQIVPYRLQYPVGPTESEYPDQPHSEILKWGVEFGWLGLVMSLVTLGLIAHRIARHGSFLLKGAGLVILPQLFFQFPFENPATVVLLALYLYLFAQSLPQQQVMWSKKIRSLSLIVGLGVVYYTIIFISSIFIESNYPHSLTKTTQACRLNPSYLRGCVRKNYNLLKDRQYSEVKKSLKEDMRLNYYAADYLKVLSDSVSEGSLEPDLVMQDESLTSISVYDSIENQSRTLEKNCQIHHVYAFIYKDQQHYSEDDVKSCKDIAAPFDLKLSPAEFDREYKSWLATLLK
jgi:O-antigen ligase